MDLAHKYISIEGPMCVGKTELAQLLAKRLNGRTVLESAENPFLERFYTDMENYAFRTQMFFLLTRYEQQREILQMHLFEQCVITDYLFDKNRIFAYLTLSDDELLIYDKVYRLISKSIPKPDLVIYLQASTRVLQKRIRSKGRPFERYVSQDYLFEMNKCYNTFFLGYEDAPLLVVNTDNVDFTDSKELEGLIDEMKRLNYGKRYYAPNLDMRRLKIR